MRYLVIGAGPAGVVAAETLRGSDRDAEILLVSGEPEPAYSRMAIPYLMTGSIDEAGTYLRRAPAHFSGLGIDFVHDRLLGFDATRRVARLEERGQSKYDRLLLAVGSRPVIPPIPGVDREGVYTCWTLADARAILDRARPGHRIVLIGAGFIGCIILEALVSMGVEVTVVEMADRMVARMMNDAAAGMIRRWCENRGVRVHTDTRVTEVATNPGTTGGLRAVLDNGESVDADLVISAAGVRPNLDCLEGTGIETRRGILVDTHLRTSDPHVFAAGDVAEGRDFSTGERDVHAIQPTATEHGRIAALNMAGKETAYQGSLIMNVLDTLGLISCSFGVWMGANGGDQAELRDDERFRYLQLQFDGDVLVGASAVGFTQHVGVLRGLIQGRTRLGPWKERLRRDPTRVMEAYLARLEPVQVAGG